MNGPGRNRLILQGSWQTCAELAVGWASRGIYTESVGAHEHKKAAPVSVRCAVVTVSDTRTETDDKSGKTIKDLLVAAGHTLGPYEIIPDEPSRIVSVVHTLTADPMLDAIVLTGGTGVAPRDCTYEAVSELLTKRLDGFGELFRMISYEEIGSAAMLSRAVPCSRTASTWPRATPGNDTGTSWSS